MVRPHCRWATKKKKRVEGAATKLDPSLMGKRVKIVGLNSRPELNNKLARVDGLQKKNGRYAITILYSLKNEKISVKPQNIVLDLAGQGADENPFERKAAWKPSNFELERRSSYKPPASKHKDGWWR